MRELNRILLTQVDPPVMVHSLRGRVYVSDCRESYGLSFCEGGQITYAQDGRRVVSVPEVAVLLPKGGRYTLYGDKTGIFPVLNFQCEGFSCPDITAIPLQNAAHYRRMYEKLRQAFLFPGNRAEIYSLFYRILADLAAETAAQEVPLRPAMVYLEEHLADPDLDNTVLARQMGISEVYFRRLFKETYHTTPKQYILEARLEKAKQLLADTAYSVTAVAAECGFSNIYHFCRLFRQRVGLSPSAYAWQNKRIGI